MALCLIFMCQILIFATVFVIGSVTHDAAADLLAKGDAALSAKKLDQSIEYYLEGIQALPAPWSGENGFHVDDVAINDAQATFPDEKEMEVILSLHTNHGTALSYLSGSTESVLSSYRAACLCYRLWQRKIDAHHVVSKEIKNAATQAYFFLGMTQQNLASAENDKVQQQQLLQNSAKSYAAATKIDPFHWSSFANMGIILADVGEGSVSLELYEEGILAYQKAIDILTSKHEKKSGATDPPENLREVVSELHYRTGLCLVPFLFSPTNKGVDDYSKKQCSFSTEPKSPPITRSCLELGAFQFQTALQFHPQHEGASSALMIATADGTFGMSTDTRKVQNLFEDYAPTFEHSLVEELSYNGFHRMRRGFDRAMVSEGHSDKNFALVVDAGCGTGLAGEVFRNISQTLIGVDLSLAIINLAKHSRPEIYTEFKTGDITTILHQYAQQEKKISLLVAADTFIYFNDLNSLFAAMEAGLEEGGYAVFSLENASVENENRLNQVKRDWRWQLTPSGRVAHRKEYVEETAKANSFETVLYEKLDNFREENGRGVRGHMFVLKKNAQRNDEL